jgi:hypothetical protein
MFGGGVALSAGAGADGQCPVKLTVCFRREYMCVRMYPFAAMVAKKSLLIS